MVRQFPDRFQVVGLAAGRNWRLLAGQIREFRPAVAAVEGEKEAEKLAEELIESGEKHWEEIQGSLSEAVKKAVDRLDLARRHEVEALKDRLENLEARLAMLEERMSSENRRNAGERSRWNSGPSPIWGGSRTLPSS